MRAYLKALATTDTCYGTGLLGNSTLVLIDTAYKNPATLWSHIAEFDDVLPASLNTLTAGDTVFFYLTGSPVASSIYMASNLQATTQSPQPRQPYEHPVSPPYRAAATVHDIAPSYILSFGRCSQLPLQRTTA